MQVTRTKLFSGVLCRVGTDLSPGWYDEVVRGDLPQWLPRDAIDTPVLNISFPLPLNDEANEESNQNGNNLSSADRPSGMCCEEDWRY